jgi:HEAT repeat protein
LRRRQRASRQSGGRSPVQLLKDEDKRVKVTAALSLADLGDKRAVTALTEQ